MPRKTPEFCNFVVNIFRDLTFTNISGSKHSKLITSDGAFK